MDDNGVRKEWIGIGWLEDGRSHGDEVLVIDDEHRLSGHFGIVLPKSNEVILFGKGRLWKEREEAEFHLRHSQGYAAPGSELHSAYVGKIGEDFWVE